MTDLVLAGCRALPLGSYLKALGVLRLVGDQLDPQARGRWAADSFELRVDVDRDGLVAFFLDEWRPTPLISPWNGGSGFKEEKNPTAVAALSRIEQSSLPRLEPYRVAIAEGRAIYDEAQRQGWDKRQVVQACRNRLPDDALAWLDASVVLTADDEAFPPLLGTGGNDGRFDFSVAYLERLSQALGLVTTRGAPTRERSLEWLRLALFRTDAVPLVAESVGQFDPGSAGGANSSPTGAADSLVNPWDWLLLLEGALAFASAAARRFGAGRGKATMPFTVNAAAVGYATGSIDEAKGSRGELWAPLWPRWASAAEVARLLGEGRVEWNGGQAGSGLDAARALATLGVDRGISHLERHALVSRNGLATMAVPVGRLAVRTIPEVALTADLDGWLRAVRRDANPPAAVRSALARLDSALFALAVHGGPVRLQTVLVTAAVLDRAVGHATGFRGRTGAIPLLLRDAPAWARGMDDGSPELRLAIAFASLSDEPASGQPWRDRPTLGWLLRPVRSDERRRALAWSAGPALVDGLGVRPVLAVLADAHVWRQLHPATDATEDAEPDALVGVRPGFGLGAEVDLADAAALLGDSVDLGRLSDLVDALVRLDWPSRATSPRSARRAAAPTPAGYALLAPHYAGPQRLRWQTLDGVGHVALRARADWLPRLRAGQVGPVLGAAAARLRMAGVAAVPGRPARSLDRELRSLAIGLDGLALAATLLLRLDERSVHSLLRQVAPIASLDPTHSDPTLKETA